MNVIPAILYNTACIASKCDYICFKTFFTSSEASDPDVENSTHYAWNRLNDGTETLAFDRSFSLRYSIWNLIYSL